MLNYWYYPQLTSEQATQLDPHLVQTMPLTDNQEQIMKEYKDSGIGTGKGIRMLQGN